MLRLERKTTESVVVEHAGETLTISLERARTGRAALGFSGSRNFKILRTELLKGSSHDRTPSQDRKPHAGQTD